MSRMGNLQKKLLDHNMPALLVLEPVNYYYLTGFTGSSGFLVVTPSKAILLTDFRYEEQAQNQVHKDVIVQKHDFPMYKTLQLTLDKLEICDLFFEKHYLTYEGYEYYRENLEGINLLPSYDLVAEMRTIKEESEIEALKKAVKIADEAFIHIINYITADVTEKELALELEYFMKRKGAEKLPFDIIIASGERSALPHGVASNKKLKKGDFVKMDFGACAQGYCSDMTRTVVLGSADRKQKQVYELVLKSQLNALRNITAGIPAWKADSYAREIIKSENLGPNFGHGLGHGVGMKVHELPRLSPRHDQILKAGMTTTIEPGVYIPGWGGVRIEDIVVIHDNGVEVLTQSTKDLIEI